MPPASESSIDSCGAVGSAASIYPDSFDDLRVR